MVTRMRNDRATFILLSILVFVLVACSPTVDDTRQQDVPVLDISGPIPESGMSRANPFPTYEHISVPGWNLRVLEIHRGEAAAELMQVEDGLSPSPPAGMQYIAVKMFVQCMYRDKDWHDFAIYELFITGDRGIAYQDDNLGQPAPELYYENFYVAQTMKAWISALIPEDEHNLILALEKEGPDGEWVNRYIALEEGASIDIPSELADISANEIGKTYTTAAHPGEVIITENWKVTLLETIRGEDALAILQEASENNQPLEGGMEYILAKLEIQYLSTQEGGKEILGSDFFVVDSQENFIWTPFFHLPKPWTRRWIYTTLYPGATYEGWVVLTAPVGDADVLLVFNTPVQEGESSPRYFSLEP